MKNICPNFEEDLFICDSHGEPKGQCVNCGDMYFNHEPAALPPEEVEMVESIYWYQLSLKYHVT